LSETKFHTYMEPQAKLYSWIFYFLSFLTADKMTEGEGKSDWNNYVQSNTVAFEEV
jgi:hypothetical protein